MEKKEKYEFILGFVGLAVSLSAFKEELKSIVINLGFVHFSFANYFFVIVIGFLICLYFYSVERVIRDTKIGNWKGFDYIIKFSYFIFILLMISPILIFASWISSKFILTINSLNNEIQNAITSLVSVIIGAISVLFSNTISSKIRKHKKDKQQEELEYQEIKEIEIAEKLLNDGYYSQSILEAFKVLELHLYKLLHQKDVRVQKHRFLDILNLSTKLEHINNNEVAKINEIRGIRNTAAHLDSKHTKEQAEKTVEFVKGILKRNT